jgi:hypothetical protein
MELIKCFEKFNQTVEKILEAIIAIRKQYYKMTQISSNVNVLKNP